MNRIRKPLLVTLLLITSLLALSGCRSIMEEDPNDQQIPWATPANWEGRVPGMPSPGGF